MCIHTNHYIDMVRVLTVKRANLSRKPAKRLSVGLLGPGQRFEHFLYRGVVLHNIVVELQLIPHRFCNSGRKHPAKW